MRGKNKIKVSSATKPIHYSKRTLFPIDPSGSYFVSFGLNRAYPCRVLKVLDTEEVPKSLLIEVDLGPEKTRNYVKADEIGRTPEEAVINTMTS